MAAVLRAPVGAATLLAREAGLLAAGLLGGRSVPLLCLWLSTRPLRLGLLVRLLRPGLSAQLLLLDRVLSVGLVLEAHW